MASEQVKPKDVETIIKRRELLQTALLGSVAFTGLAPILALARGPAPAKAGDTICSEIRNLQRKRYKANELIFGEVYVRQNNSERVLGFYTLRGPFEDIFAPSVVISRTDGQVFAYANDLEWFIYIITDPASAWFTRVGNITREHLWNRRRQNSEERVDLVHQVYKPPRLGQKIQRKRGGEAYMPRLPPPRH